MFRLRRSCASRSALSYLRCGRVLRTPFISARWKTLIQATRLAEKQQSKKVTFLSPPHIQVRVTPTFIAPDTVQWKISSYILRIMSESQYNVVPYCAHDITCGSATYRVMVPSCYLRNWSAHRPRSQFRNCDQDRSELQSRVRESRTLITKSFAWEKNFTTECPLHISRSDAPIVPRCCRRRIVEYASDACACAAQLVSRLDTIHIGRRARQLSADTICGIWIMNRPLSQFRNSARELHVGKSVRCRAVLCAWYHVPKRNVTGHGTLTLPYLGVHSGLGRSSGTATRAGGNSKVAWGYHELRFEYKIFCSRKELHNRMPASHQPIRCPDCAPMLPETNYGVRIRCMRDPALVAPGHHSHWPTRKRIFGRSGSGVVFIITPFPIYLFDSPRTCFAKHLVTYGSTLSPTGPHTPFCFPFYLFFFKFMKTSGPPVDKNTCHQT